MARNYPLSALNSLTRDFDSLIDTFFQPAQRPRASEYVPCGHYPAMNFNESDEEYTVDVVAPGIDPDAFNINVTDNILTISNHTEQEEKEEHKPEEKAEAGESGKTKSWYSYTFSRSVQLPKDANAEAIQAEYRNGVLKLHIPKMEEAKPKRIKVDVH
jgi:HSP20 family protein